MELLSLSKLTDVYSATSRSIYDKSETVGKCVSNCILSCKLETDGLSYFVPLTHPISSSMTPLVLNHFLCIAVFTSRSRRLFLCTKEFVSNTIIMHLTTARRFNQASLPKTRALPTPSPEVGSAYYPIPSPSHSARCLHTHHTHPRPQTRHGYW